VMNSYGWVDANGQPYLVDPTRAKINAVLLAVEAHVLDNQIAALKREYAQLKKQYNARVPGVMGAIRAGVKAQMVPRLQKLAVSLRTLHGKRAEIAREFAEGGFQGLEFATFAKTDEFKPFASGRGWKGAYDVAKWILRGSPTRDAGVEPSYDDVNAFLLFGGLLRAKLASLGRSAVCDDAVGTATQASEVVAPRVVNSKLNNLVNDLYKGAKGPRPIGTGSTADAVRNELATGLSTHGRFHSQKGQEYINALMKWLRNNPNASHHDRLVAQSLLDDLKAALGGN